MAGRAGSNNQSPSSRRDVLKGIAAAGSIAVLPTGFGARLARAAAPGPTAVVIGAGIAGLSAAYELKRAGFRVSIFEKENYTGGRMREGWMGPLYGPIHAQGVFKASREMLALADEVGVGDGLDGISEDYMVENGVGVYNVSSRFHADEVGKVPGMSDDTKRLLPRLQADLDLIQQQVDPCLMATGAAFDDETLAQYYERVLGKEAGGEVLRYWVEPILDWFSWPAKSTSKIALLSWYGQQQSDFVSPRGGIGVLTRRLGDLLNVQHEVTVQSVTPADSAGRHTIHYLTPELERRSITPDIVVCATEGRYVDKIVQGLTPKQSTFFNSVFTTTSAVMFYILDEKAAPNAVIGENYIPSHPDPIKRRINGWAVSPADPTNHNRPANIRITLSHPEVPVWQSSNKTLPEYCEPLIKHVYPAFDMNNVVDIVNYTCDHLIYMPIGYCRQMAEVLRDQEKERRGLYFAGEYIAGAHTGAACASGRTVGRLIAKQWKA
jgi:hypothetical protein